MQSHAPLATLKLGVPLFADLLVLHMRSQRARQYARRQRGLATALGLQAGTRQSQTMRPGESHSPLATLELCVHCLRIGWYCMCGLSVPGNMHGSYEDCLLRWVCKWGRGNRRLCARGSHMRRWLHLELWVTRFVDRLVLHMRSQRAANLQGSSDVWLQRSVCKRGRDNRRLYARCSHTRRWLHWSCELHCLRICWYCICGLSMPGNMHGSYDDCLERGVCKCGRDNRKLCARWSHMRRWLH